MCGIGGLVFPGQGANPEQLRVMAGKLAHRGPDDVGLYVDGDVGLVHTRLSIIDLAHGHQPLFADDDNLVVIANGEIYNFIELGEELARKGHRFSTHSDCEVILHAYAEYGLAFLSRLMGMFAFALYDRRRERLVLARDRLGIKPLFLARLAGGIAFASELKPLLAVLDTPAEVNPEGLIQFLQNQFSTGHTTVVRQIERLLPAEAVCFESGRLVKRWRYWSALDVEPLALDYPEAEERFDALMETVMRQHMRSDVPFGLFLSGGVDSSILLALLSRYSGHPIRSFSVGFRDSKDGQYLAFAEQCAQRFGSPHTLLEPSRSDMLQRLPHTIWAADELMRDPANLPTALLAEETRRELKVVFSGEGGDEVFAGYGRYRTSRLERWAKALLAPGSGGFRTRGTFRGAWSARLFGPELSAMLDRFRQPVVDAWQTAPKGWTDLQRMQYTDLATALPDNLLVKIDRMLMGWGVEGRVPFLDHRVVEFGLALPDHLKVNGSHGKLFLKQWALRFLPREQLFAQKRGFRVPIDRWLGNDFLVRLGERLPQHPAIRRWFQPDGVRELIDRRRQSGAGVRMLSSLLQFAIWHQMFIDGRGEPPPALQDPLEALG